jgi:hypothetical protein
MTVGERGGSVTMTGGERGGSVTQVWSVDVGALSVMPSTEPSGDRVGVGDGARCEHGACDVHGTCSGGAHGTRGDAVGVGDISEVPGGARSAGDAAGDDDGGGAGREYHTSFVRGFDCIERDASTEPSGDRVSVGDSARGEHGACDVHGTGSGGAHGVRGDAVGVGDIADLKANEKKI